jgi:hypothetical protein
MNTLCFDVILVIVEHIHDERALVRFAATSRLMRWAVMTKSIIWKNYYESDFSLKDDKEQAWLNVFTRRNAGLYPSTSLTGSLRFPVVSNQFNWFIAYCHRRATEYRWRHGLYKLHKLIPATRESLSGIRIQSVPCSRQDPMQLFVATQRIIHPGKSPCWFIEYPNWGDVDIKDKHLTDMQYSETYMIVALETSLEHLGPGCTSASLYFWHLDALYKPPKLMMKGVQGSFSLHRNWVIIDHIIETNRPVNHTFLFDLNQNKMCPDVIYDGLGSQHALISTPDKIRIVWKTHYITKDKKVEGIWKIWEYSPKDTLTAQCIAYGQLPLNTRPHLVYTQRVDENRFLIYGKARRVSTTEGSPPTVALMEITKKGHETQVEQVWAITSTAYGYTPITSQNMIIASSYDTIELLDMSNGKCLHSLSSGMLESWEKSGIYPARSQWTNINLDKGWKCPLHDPNSNVPNDSVGTFFTNGILYVSRSNMVVVDYLI